MSAQLSVIVPTCDRPDLLRRCVAALAEQPANLLRRVYVVNDGRIDVDDVCRASGLAAKITLLRTPRLGPGLARNAAIRALDGDHVAFLDDDSTPRPDWAERCVGLFDRCPEVTAQLGRILWSRASEALPWRERFVPMLRQKLYDTRHATYSERAFLAAVCDALARPIPVGVPGAACHLSGGNSAIRAGFFREHGPFDARYRTYHDRELAFRVLRRGGFVAYNPSMVVEHAHDPSIRRALSRSYNAVPYQRLLEDEYRGAPWAALDRGGARGAFVRDLSVPLSRGERAFMRLQAVVRHAALARLRVGEVLRGGAR
ncbi:MAG: glycosyltransferase family 2 protein [Polyangiales bacterium]